MNNQYKTKGLSTSRILILLLNYFLGYIFIYPLFISFISQYFHLSASQNSLLLYCFYILMIVISVVAGFPVLKESYQRLPRFAKFAQNTLLFFVLLFFVNVLGNSLVVTLTGTTNSVNQQQIIQSFMQDPILIIFSTLIYAPIVEELVFRGAIFRPLRAVSNFWVAALVSGVSFGLIHVLDSLLVGNFVDGIYIFSYAALGMVFCWAYEKNHSIYGSLALHFMNNFVGVIGIILSLSMV